jgi:hypothetical protein
MPGRQLCQGSAATSCASAAAHTRRFCTGGISGRIRLDLPAPVINFKTQPKVPTTEASGVQPIRGPDGRTRWYALVGAAAWTSIGGRMGMFAYVADNMTGPYEQLSNYEIMACEY